MAGPAPPLLEGYSLRARLRTHIQAGAFGPQVVDDLLPGGSPYWFEKSLWDYKLHLPVAPRGRTLSSAEKQTLDWECSRIIKDIVSFYSTYGGYLVIGVRDNPRAVEGFGEYFDVAEIIKRTSAVTKHEIDCHYAVHYIEIGDQKKAIGLMFVPQRPAGREPAQFLRDAPSDPEGKLAFRKRQIYFRAGDECRPAETAAELNFLCSLERCNESMRTPATSRQSLSHNLGQRDAGFVTFVGRETYLRELWKWFCDAYSPTKLLSGQGGVGKTTLAREFVEDAIRSAPMGLECVIWLSAKQRFYSAGEGKYVDRARVDFNDTQTLLRRLLGELGYPSEMIDPECTNEELVDLMVETLKVMPSLLVIDDVDSLEPAQQHEVFHAILQITDRTIGTAKVASRAILTARLTLGAAPAQLLYVKGLEPDDFWKYVLVTAENMQLPWPVGQNSKLMAKFHKVTDGSPMFASSILRLVKLGHTIDKAIDTWKGHDGEEVRDAAFLRELDQLSDSQIRTLYAAIVLGETTFAELRSVLDSGETLLKNNIGELHKYHLLAVGSDVPNSGTRLVVPNSLQVMQGMIKKRVSQSRTIEQAISRLRRKASDNNTDAPRFARTILALSSKGSHPEALETALWADKQRPDADLKCLLASTYLRITPPNAIQADIEFRRAYDLGCKRTELTKLWAQAKELSEDWVGLLEITQLPNRDSPIADDLVLRAQAYLKLSEIAYKAGQHDGAANHCFKGATEINDAFKAGRISRGDVRLIEVRSQLLERYVKMKDIAYSAPDDHLYVWEACMDAFWFQVRTPSIIEVGMDRLQTWWKAVERRSTFQFDAKKKLRHQLDRAQQVLAWYCKQGSNYVSTVELLKSRIEDLELQSSNYI